MALSSPAGNKTILYGVIKASSETSDPQEALAELRAGEYRLWSTMPTPAHGRVETYLAALDGRGGRYETRPSFLINCTLRDVVWPLVCMSAALSCYFGRVCSTVLTQLFVGVGMLKKSGKCAMPKLLWKICTAQGRA